MDPTLLLIGDLSSLPDLQRLFAASVSLSVRLSWYWGVDRRDVHLNPGEPASFGFLLRSILLPRRVVSQKHEHSRRELQCQP